ncbi:hypothetical protein GTA08_BOTSDO10174 [Neofusicoccum parvum]|nr:hypothetical protein GTA08_BOTSDO10174 [Neofusicoccum parvum]
MPSERISGEEQPHATAYLDGLRGIASLVVLSFHTLWAYFAFVEYGYGDGPTNRHFLQLPVVRLVHAGHAMVPVFFVVGGYVMALKPFRKIRARDCEDLPVFLAGSMVRKAIRLYLPAVIVTLVSMLTLHLGLWEYPRRFLASKRFFNYPDKHPLPEKTIFAEASRWVRATVGLTNIFSYVNHGFVLPYYNPYDPHLWYLPFELRASLATAFVLLALSRFRQPSIRTTLTLAAAILATSLDRWECALFLSGALLADLDTRFPPSSASPRFLLLFSLPSLTASLYLLSTPNLRILHTPGYALLRANFVPPAISDPKRFLHGAGAVLLLAALRRCPPLQRPLGSRPARAAGRRSYALYVVHGPVLHVVGYGVAAGVWRAVGCRGEEDEEAWRWAVGAAVGSVGAWGVGWWVAGWFERVVERRCRSVAGWVEGWLFGEGEREREAEGMLPR